MQESVFTKIIKGELPSHKIYEDDKTIAFLTIGPLLEGHTLVVPKVQVDDFEALSHEDYQALFDTVRKVTTRIKEVYGVRKAIVNIMGYEVPHAHVHVIPADSEEIYFQAIKDMSDQQTEPDHETLARIAERLSF